MNRISKRQYRFIVIVAALLSLAVAYLLRIWNDWDPFIKGLISGLTFSIPAVVAKKWLLPKEEKKGNG